MELHNSNELSQDTTKQLSPYSFQPEERYKLCRELSKVFRVRPRSICSQYIMWDEEFKSSRDSMSSRRNPISTQFQSSQSDFADHLTTCKRVGIVGIDFPCLFEYKDGDSLKKTIMLVAQDPRRKPGYPELGVVFGFENKGAVGPGNKYFRLIHILLELGFRVYVTDAYKLWAGGKGLPQGDQYQFIDLLAEEIKIFQPCAIISLGDIAEKAVEKINPRESKLINFHHPSERNNFNYPEIGTGRNWESGYEEYFRTRIENELGHSSTIDACSKITVGWGFNSEQTIRYYIAYQLGIQVPHYSGRGRKVPRTKTVERWIKGPEAVEMHIGRHISYWVSKLNANALNNSC